METIITFRPSCQHTWAWFLMFTIACLSLVYSPAHAISGDETDRLALLVFKAKITADPLGVLSSWNDSSHFCSWFGITCGKRHRRVTVLNLSSSQLGGSISPCIGKLTFLRIVDLHNNSLINQIPPEMGYLRRLKTLHLYYNSLSGEIPSNLSRCAQLVTLSLGRNNLTGEIPEELGTLSKLQFLAVHINNLTGEIPSSLGNLSSLVKLSAAENNLVGSIPDALGRLNQLTFLPLFGNQLSGNVPSSIFNLSSLTQLDLGQNDLRGYLPSDLFLTLPNLNFLSVGQNQFSGPIPTSLSNASNLGILNLESNQISGTIPAGIGSLVGLNILRLDNNNFSGTIPESLGNLANLSDLGMSINNLEGNIPPSLGNCNTLQYLDLGWNNLSGSLPPEAIGLSSLVVLSIAKNNIYGSVPKSLCNATKLEMLDLSYNYLKGTIPDCLIEMSPALGVLALAGNSIGGSIPDKFGKGCRLQTLRLNWNLLHGQIPRSLANCTELKLLDVGNNQLRDTFPCQLKTLSQMQVLILRSNKLRGNVACPGEHFIWPLLQIIDLASNHFNGEITTQFISKSKSMRTGTKGWQSKPDRLQYNDSIGGYYLDPFILTFKNNEFQMREVLEIYTSIDLSNNTFYGEIPRELGNLNALTFLNLSHNSLTGNIPSSFGNLSQLESLDLSCNSLHGSIPQELAKLNFLESLNLSFNKLVGPIPTGKQLQLFNASSYQGNQGLYGPPLTPRTPLVPTHAPGSIPPTRAFSTKLKLGIAIGSGIIGAALLVSLIFLLTLRMKKQATASSSSEFSLPQVSYQDLQRATNGFSLEKLIGVGYFASVYKGILHEEEPLLAIKVFNLDRRGAAKSFLAECEALRNIRHRNLVKVITACSSTDYQGNEFKALVYEFMPNGSLEDWLHQVGKVSDTQEAPKKLTLLQRLSIAFDVASALEYLHCECETPIVHCDLKPSNVLLDNELTGHVSDFGIAKLLSEDVQGSTSAANPSSSIGVRGTIGYAAPEYGLGSEVSMQGDVYSYGILLLEMFTGKRPTADMFKEGWSLHQYARRALLDGVEKIIDPTLVKGERGTREEVKIIECLAVILEIGVACSAECPGDRMNITDAAKRLHLIKKEVLKLRRYYQLY